MACTKQFSITVVEGETPCDLFEDIVWGAPDIDTGCSGSFVANTFSAEATAPPDPGPGFCSARGADCLGTVTNPGDEMECCLSLTVLIADALLNISIFDFSTFTSLLNLTQADAVAPGNYSFPFTVPAGAIMQIGVEVSSESGDACSADLGTESITGSFGGCP